MMFAQTTDSTTIGAFVTVVIAFLTIAKIMLRQATKDRDADRKERIRFSIAIEKMAQGSERVADTNKQIADAVNKQADESAERNGHLGELIVKQGELTKEIAERSVSEIINVVQHVDKQEVEHQHVRTQD